MSVDASTVSSSSLVVGGDDAAFALRDPAEDERLEQLVDTLYQRFARLGKRQTPATGATTAPATDFLAGAAAGAGPNWPDSNRASPVAGRARARQTPTAAEREGRPVAPLSRRTPNTVPNGEGEANTSGVLAGSGAGGQRSPGNMVLRPRASTYWEERELYVAAEDICCFLNGGVNYRDMCYQYQHVLDLVLRMVREDIAVGRTLLSTSSNHNPNNGGRAATEAAVDLASIDTLVQELRSLMQESGRLLRQNGIELPAGFGGGLLSEVMSPSRASGMRRGHGLTGGAAAAGGRHATGSGSPPSVAILPNPLGDERHGGTGGSRAHTPRGRAHSGGYTPLSNVDLASALRHHHHHHHHQPSHPSSTTRHHQHSILSGCGQPQSGGAAAAETSMVSAECGLAARPPGGSILRTGSLGGIDAAHRRLSISAVDPTPSTTTAAAAAAAHAGRRGDGLGPGPARASEPPGGVPASGWGRIDGAAAGMDTGTVEDFLHSITGGSPEGERSAGPGQDLSPAPHRGNGAAAVNGGIHSPHPTQPPRDRKRELLAVYASGYREAGMDLLLDAMDIVFRYAYDQAPAPTAISGATTSPAAAVGAGAGGVVNSTGDPTAAFKALRRDVMDRVLPALDSYEAFRTATADVTPMRSAYLAHCLAARTKPHGDVLELLASTRERELDVLPLANAKLGDAGARAVLQLVPRLHRLRVLDLRRNELHDEVLADLVEAVRHHPALTTVLLSHNHLTGAGLGALLALARATPQLRELALQGCELSPESRQAVAAALAGSDHVKHTGINAGAAGVAGTSPPQGQRAVSAPAPTPVAVTATVGPVPATGATPPPRGEGSRLPTRPVSTYRAVRYLPMPGRRPSGAPVLPPARAASERRSSLTKGSGEEGEGAMVRLPALTPARGGGSTSRVLSGASTPGKAGRQPPRRDSRSGSIIGRAGLPRPSPDVNT